MAKKDTRSRVTPEVQHEQKATESSTRTSSPSKPNRAASKTDPDILNLTQARPTLNKCTHAIEHPPTLK